MAVVGQFTKTDPEGLSRQRSHRVRPEQAHDPAGGAAQFDFYREDPELLLESARRHGSSDIIHAHGEFHRMLALRAQGEPRRCCCWPILPPTPMPSSAATRAARYSSTPARRPILAFGRNNAVIEDMLTAGSLGYHARDEESCMAFIRVPYDRFRAGTFAPDVKAEWRPLSPRDLAGRFAELLDESAGAL